MNIRRTMSDQPAAAIPKAAWVDTKQIAWPNGKKFAFSIVDDTDLATVATVKPIYDLLQEHGFRTTKTVWPLKAKRPKWRYGSLEDEDYREWILSLHRNGFEIAIHGTADEPSRREEVLRGLNYFREVFGSDPRMHVNHVGQEELVYWYDRRFHGITRYMYWLANKLKRRTQTSGNLGHVAGSEYFWGDLCSQRIEYVRNLTFRDINTLAQDPFMPYHDPSRPYVKYWYSATEGSTGPRFCDQISPENQDRLMLEGGACILYTHFAFGFVKDGKVLPRFRELIARLASLPGWFVPTSELLDFLKERRDWRETREPLSLQLMELKWLMEKWKVGTK
jgi:hypothetical protein